MSKIRIKNFGPIKDGYLEEDGWMDIKKVTVFIGDQGSGKSTVAKLISTFTWIEKALTRGDYDEKYFERSGRIKNQFLTYHRIENYFRQFTPIPSFKKPPSNDLYSKIEYHGESYNFVYENGVLSIQKAKTEFYSLPQVMYVPAERNFIANVKNPKALKLTSDSLIEFVTEYDNAKEKIDGSLKLPINHSEVEYQKLNDIVYLKAKGYKIKLSESSSGFQSFVPLYLVTWFLANSVKRQRENGAEMTSEQREMFRKRMQVINEIPDLSEEQKRIAISEEAKKFNKTAFINIAEEPEQNLFPTSQRAMLNSLVEFNNMSPGNKLIMTTHSPYLINYLTHSIKAYMVLEKIKISKDAKNLEDKLNLIVPVKSTVAPDNWVVYELNEIDGTIKKLRDYKNLPSDENYLNTEMGDANEIFANLLEIEDLCQIS